MIKLLLAATLAVSLSAQADFDGIVTSVIDGDTIKVLDKNKVEHKVRLKGIDAPEKGQPFGVASKQYLAGFIYGQEVGVEGTKKDRYGRLLGKVWIDGMDINLLQLRSGMAWHYKRYMPEQRKQDRKEYADQELDAQIGKRGLWADADPIEPWEWRQSP